MYPVISVLRRCAATQIFVRPEQLEVSEKRLWLRLKTPSNYWDISKSSWGPVHTSVPMFELRVSAKSREAAAIALVQLENKVAEKMKAAENYYTMIFGPEIEDEKDGQVTRKVRLAVVRGVYRAAGPSTLEINPTKTPIVKRFQKPPGATYNDP